MSVDLSKGKKGVTLEDVLDLSPAELRKLSGKELRTATGILRDAANKRYERIQRSGRTTVASKNLSASGGKINLRGKSDADVIKEFQRAKKFLSMKSSTASKRPSKYQKYLDLTPQQFRQLSGPELKKAVQELSKVANRRLKKLEELDAQNITSPAYEGWKKQGLGTFGAGRKFDMDKLRTEYKRVSEFLINPTSSAQKTKTLLKRIQRAIERKTKVSIENEKMEDLFSAYSRIREDNKLLGKESYKNFRYEVFRLIAERINDNFDVDEIMADLETELENLKAEMQGQQSSPVNGVDVT